jgi:cyanate permease
MGWQMHSLNLKHGLIALTALVVGIARPFLTSHPLSADGSYEAFAHLFVGGLIGAWLMTRERLYLLLVVGLSIVELASALLK